MKNIIPFLFLLFVLACTKHKACYDCEIKTKFDWYMTPEHDTIFYHDTVETWCDIDPANFERINTDTVYVFYIDDQGRITRLWGYQFITTKCKPNANNQ